MHLKGADHHNFPSNGQQKLKRENIEEKNSCVNYIVILIIFYVLYLISLVICFFFQEIILYILAISTSIFLLLIIILLIIFIITKKNKQINYLNKYKENLINLEEKEEDIKNNILKNKILDKEKKLREKKEIVDTTQLSEKERNEQLNEVLEDMCIYGNIMKKQIKEEKKKNPEKFIDTSQALQLENKDQELFALGLISQNLEELGIETAIEREENNEEEEEDAGTTCLQFITNGLAGKKKYDLHFEFDEKRNKELLNNEEEYKKFKKNLKLKLSKDYNIPVDKIIPSKRKCPCSSYFPK